ncbi:immunoglobulin-binding protein EIBE [Brucella ceti TE28753-12]|nr:immunoglobulin-binding protein EIBE [Brucella ceti TE28753-12]
MLSLAVDAAKAEENVSQVKLPPVFVFELVENQGLANIALIRPRVIAPDNNLRPGGIVSGIAGLLTLGQENRNLISENRQVINNNTTAIGQNRTSISTNAKGVADNRLLLADRTALRFPLLASELTGCKVRSTAPGKRHVPELQMPLLFRG